MNSFLVYQHEITDSIIVSLKDSRASLFNTRYGYSAGVSKTKRRCKVGSEIKLGIFGDCRAIGKVIESSTEIIKLEIIKKSPAPNRLAMTLIVGLCRPQTVKKVVSLAASFGVERLIFVATELGEKSYLKSSIFNDGTVNAEVLQALEQVWDVIGPEILVKDGFANVLEQNAGTKIFFADTGEGLILYKDGIKTGVGGDSSVVCVGPEAGWSDNERAVAIEFRALHISLGDRMLRVEHAVGSLIDLLNIRRTSL